MRVEVVNRKSDFTSLIRTLLRQIPERTLDLAIAQNSAAYDFHAHQLQPCGTSRQNHCSRGKIVQ